MSKCLREVRGRFDYSGTIVREVDFDESEKWMQLQQVWWGMFGSIDKYECIEIGSKRRKCKRMEKDYVGRKVGLLDAPIIVARQSLACLHRYRYWLLCMPPSTRTMFNFAHRGAPCFNKRFINGFRNYKHPPHDTPVAESANHPHNRLFSLADI